jgi:hypothetical protein
MPIACSALKAAEIQGKQYPADRASLCMLHRRMLPWVNL